VRSAKRVHQSVFGRRRREACHYLSCVQKHVDKIETGLHKLDKTMNGFAPAAPQSLMLCTWEKIHSFATCYGEHQRFCRPLLPFANQRRPSTSGPVDNIRLVGYLLPPGPPVQLSSLVAHTAQLQAKPQILSLVFLITQLLLFLLSSEASWSSVFCPIPAGASNTSFPRSIQRQDDAVYRIYGCYHHGPCGPCPKPTLRHLVSPTLWGRINPVAHQPT
jgi:hypothetical protein